MPTPSINMRKLKDALRFSLVGGQSHQQIASALGIAKGSVTKYCTLAATAGLNWSAIEAMSETDLEHRLFGSSSATMFVRPDYARIHQELRRKGVTVMLLWQEYSAQVGDEHCEQFPLKALRYSQFSENYRQFAKRIKRSMRQTHRAGEKVLIDYAGPTIALMEHGVQVGRANIFVAAMAASGYSFAMATPRQTAADWLNGTACALTFFGGVPQLIIPDNPRALVTQANRYEPILTDSVLDFARHCGCSVLPARLPPAGQSQSRVERTSGRTLNTGVPAPPALCQRARSQRRHGPCWNA